MKRIRIAIVGDFTENKHTHHALNDCIRHCQQVFPALEASWIPTTSITNPASFQDIADGLWIAPGSPYKKDDAVYDTIQWARENNFPVLGTCGGFQYMVVEYAQHVVGINHAGHEESEPDRADLVISRLSCSLKGQQEEVLIADKTSWLYRVLQKDRVTGFFNCNFGVNPLYTERLHQHPMTFTAFSTTGEVRGLELKGHRFFNGTLFQPPLESSVESPNPLILDFIRQCSL